MTNSAEVPEKAGRRSVDVVVLTLSTGVLKVLPEFL